MLANRSLHAIRAPSTFTSRRCHHPLAAISLFHCKTCESGSQRRVVPPQRTRARTRFARFGSRLTKIPSTTMPLVQPRPCSNIRRASRALSQEWFIHRERELVRVLHGLVVDAPIRCRLRSSFHCKTSTALRTLSANAHDWSQGLAFRRRSEITIFPCVISQS